MSRIQPTSPPSAPYDEQVRAWLLAHSVSLDFETFSAAGYVWDSAKRAFRTIAPGRPGGLPAIGAAAYAAHPSTEVECLTFEKNGIQESWVRGMPAPAELCQHVQSGGIITGQNVMFEFWLWDWVLHKRLGWPQLKISQLVDTAALCRAYGAPGSLDGAGKVLLPSELQKHKDEGKKLIKIFSVPHKPTKAEPDRRRITFADRPIDAARFLLYNQQDVTAERGLLAACPPLLAEEQRMWTLDAEINERGVTVDYAGLQRCISWTNHHTAVGTARLQKLTNNEVKKPTELKKIGEYLERCGLKVPRTKKDKFNLDEDAINQLLGLPIPPHIREMLTIRQDIGGAAVKKLFAMERMLSPGMKLRGMFTYHMAHTGRWAGSGVQLHNMPPSLKVPGGWGYEAFIEHTLYGTQMSMKDVKGCLRGLLVASPGHDFISSDYNAIEAVVTAVVAGEEWRLDVFRTHGKIYEASASKITGIPFEDFATYREVNGEHHPMRGKIGKPAELASGFGGWIGAWKNFGAGKHLTDEQIRDGVLSWRAASPNIVELWGGQWREVPGASWGERFKAEWFGLEGAFVAALHQPDVPVRVGQHLTLQYYSGEDVLRVHLPSGRSLVYRSPRLAPGIHNFSKRPQFELSYLGYKEGRVQRIETYGGKLTENVVQAIARDILRDAMLLLKDNGYPVVLHVHDEPTAEVPEGFGSVEELEKIILTLAPWCASWPIRASGGWRGKRFRK